MNDIKYLDSAGLQTFASAIKDKIDTGANKAVYSVNGYDIAGNSGNTEHNVTLSYIENAGHAGHAELADKAIDLESKTLVEQTQSFDLRTSGGSDDIFSGKAYFKEIHGNSYYHAYIPPQLTAIPSADVDSFDDWTRTANAVTFGNKLGENKKSGQYVFSYNGSSWSVSSENNAAINNNTIALSEWGLTFDPPDHVLPSSMTITCDYVVESNSIHIPAVLNNFYSIGFNLYDNESGIAQVVGNEDYIIQYNDFTNYEAKFSLDGTNWDEQPIALRNETIMLTQISKVFTPKSNGYIGIFSKSDGELKAINNLMINLIWSGKNIEANGTSPFQAYKKYTKQFQTVTENNEFQNGVTLDRINDVYDYIDFLEKNDGYYVKKQRIFNFTYESGDLESYFANIKYQKDGNTVYYDCESLAEHINELPDVNTENKTFKFPNSDNRIPYVDEIVKIKIRVRDNNEDPVSPAVTADNSYDVDDFGLEKIDAGYILNGTSIRIPLEINVTYTANLIDKLRRNVITYSLQPSVSDEQRATGRQNLQLITANCFVGARNVYVSADKIDGSGNVIEFGPRAWSTVESKYATFQLPSLGIWKFSTTINGQETSIIQELNYYGTYDIKLVGKRYGFKREKNNQNPSTRITYLFDAEHFNPITFGDSGADLGDWEDFIKEVACPVYIVNDGIGTVRKLSFTDQNYTAEGTLNTTTDNGNFMVGFYKYKYVARKQDSLFEYVVFCDEDLSDNEWDYQCYAHAMTVDTSGQNVVIKPGNAFYWGMFNSDYYTNNDITYLHSVPTANYTGTSAFTLAQLETFARNWAPTYAEDTTGKLKRWNIGYKSGWDYICDLITLVTKSDDASAIFGPGLGFKNTAAGGNVTLSSAFGDGFAADSASDGNAHTRAFWIWDFYGGIRQPMLGFFRKNITNTGNLNNTFYYIKMHDADKEYLPYDSSIQSNTSIFALNFDTSSSTADVASDSSYLAYGYVKMVNDKFIEKSGNFISQETVNNYGIIPTKATITASGNGISDAIVAPGIGAKLTYFATTGVAVPSTSGANLLKNGPRALDFTYYTKTTAGVPSALTSAIMRPRLTCIEPEV